jgi:hypothetical protein
MEKQMKKTILMTSVAILCLGNINESWAYTCTWEGTKLTVTGDKNGNETFTGCPDNSHKSATEVKFKEGITSIGDRAFQFATPLKSVDMPNVTEIGEHAFENTFSLISIDTTNVTSIKQYAFNGASSLTSIDMSKVTSIGAFTFNAAKSLTDIIISDDIDTENWDINALYGCTQKNITCLDNIDTCMLKLAKYFPNYNCPSNLTCTCTTSNYYCISPSKVLEATESQCNSLENYYYSEECIKLPNTRLACEGAEFSWINNTCTKLSPATYCTDRRELLQGNTCVSSCGAGYKLENGVCWRRRYTPAEVAKIVGESNTILLYYK